MNALAQLGIAIATAVAVGVLSLVGWVGFLIGATLALSLWVMLFAGSYARPVAGRERGLVDTRAYATAAVVGIALGYVLFRIGADDNAVWWAPGFILAGAALPAVGAARHDR